MLALRFLRGCSRTLRTPWRVGPLPTRRPAILRYSLALYAPAVAVLPAMTARLFAVLFAPTLQPATESLALLLLLTAVVFSAGYGGLAPGLLSSGASVLLLGYLFIEPLFRLTLQSPRLLFALGGFVLATVLVCFGRVLWQKGRV